MSPLCVVCIISISLAAELAPNRQPDNEFGLTGISAGTASYAVSSLGGAKINLPFEDDDAHGFVHHPDGRRVVESITIGDVPCYPDHRQSDHMDGSSIACTTAASAQSFSYSNVNLHYYAAGEEAVVRTRVLTPAVNVQAPASATMLGFPAADDAISVVAGDVIPPRYNVCTHQRAIRQREGARMLGLACGACERQRGKRDEPDLDTDLAAVFLLRDSSNATSLSTGEFKMSGRYTAPAFPTKKIAFCNSVRRECTGSQHRFIIVDSATLACFKPQVH